MRSHRIHGFAAAAILGLLLVPPAGAAPLPDVEHPTIVPNTQIGGVRLDMTKGQVQGKWGPGACRASGGQPPTTICIWGSKDPTQGESAQISFASNRAVIIGIYARVRASDGRIIPGRLARDWKTGRGIHLNSPKGAVKDAYPAARPNNGEAVNGYDLFAGARPNLRYTRFSTPGFGASANRVRSIVLQWDVCHYLNC